MASALHETAHWCIAGKARRAIKDFGYRYQADRDPTEQQDFCRFESRPQALESIFHDAIGSELFTPSLDGIEYQNNIVLLEEFSEQIQQKKQSYLINGLPKRAKKFVDALKKIKT